MRSNKSASTSSSSPPPSSASAAPCSSSQRAASSSSSSSAKLSSLNESPASIAPSSSLALSRPARLSGASSCRCRRHRRCRRARRQPRQRRRQSGAPRPRRSRPPPPAPLSPLPRRRAGASATFCPAARPPPPRPRGRRRSLRRRIRPPPPTPPRTTLPPPKTPLCAPLLRPPRRGRSPLARALARAPFSARALTAPSPSTRASPSTSSAAPGRGPRLGRWRTRCVCQRSFARSTRWKVRAPGSGLLSAQQMHARRNARRIRPRRRWRSRGGWCGHPPEPRARATAGAARQTSAVWLFTPINDAVQRTAMTAPRRSWAAAGFVALALIVQSRRGQSRVRIQSAN